MSRFHCIPNWLTCAPFRDPDIQLGTSHIFGGEPAGGELNIGSLCDAEVVMPGTIYGESAAHLGRCRSRLSSRKYAVTTHSQLNRLCLYVRSRPIDMVREGNSPSFSAGATPR